MSSVNLCRRASIRWSGCSIWECCRVGDVGCCSAVGFSTGCCRKPGGCSEVSAFIALSTSDMIFQLLWQAVHCNLHSANSLSKIHLLRLHSPNIGFDFVQFGPNLCSSLVILCDFCQIIPLCHLLWMPHHWSRLIEEEFYCRTSPETWITSPDPTAAMEYASKSTHRTGLSTRFYRWRKVRQ